MAIDSRARGIAKRLLAAELRRRDKLFAQDLVQAKEEISFQGALRSSRTVVVVGNLAARELRVRMNLAWDTLLRVLSEIGVRVDDDVRRDLTDWINGVLEETFDILASRVNNEMNKLGLGALTNLLRDEATALRDEFEARADLLVATLQQRTENTDPSTV